MLRADPARRAALLNLLLTQQLEWRAPQQRRFPQELATQHPQLGAKELAQAKQEVATASEHGVRLARSLVDASGGFQYVEPWRNQIYSQWEPAMGQEFSWMDSELRPRLFSAAMATIYQEDRVKYG